MHGINDNILITPLYYLGVYPDEAKKWDLYKEVILGGLEPNPPKNWQNGGARSSVNIGKLNIDICTTVFFNGFWV